MDNGTSLCSAITLLKDFGQAKEESWSYNSTCILSPDTYFPTKEALIEALKNKINFGERIPIDINIVQNKIKEGYAVIIGIVLFEEFFKPQKGFIEFPQNIAKDFGGHAVLIAGWDTYSNNDVFIVRNSWGECWGIDGYGFLPYKYFSKYTIDAWCFSIN